MGGVGCCDTAGQVQPAARFVAGLAPLRPIQGILLKGTAGGPARLRRGPAFGTGALIIIYMSEPLTPALRGPDMF
jgi:hypothetical protein